MSTRFDRGVEISELPAILQSNFNADAVIEVSYNGASFKGTIGQLILTLGGNFHTRDEMTLLLEGKQAVGSMIEDAQKLQGNTLQEVLDLAAQLPTGSATDVGGLTPDQIATKAEVAELQNQISQLAALLDQLFDSLNG